jgi:undecaprenyl-diphosphatase
LKKYFQPPFFLIGHNRFYAPDGVIAACDVDIIAGLFVVSLARQTYKGDASLMSIWQAILLGLIQGLTEFIPISSTAHLTIAGNLMGLIKSDSPEEWTAFIAVIQLGTLLAVIAYFWSDIIKIIHGFVAANLALITKRPVDQSTRSYNRLGWFVILGTIPIAVVGLIFKDLIEGSLTKNLWIIAGSLIGLAIVLTVAEIVGPQKRDMTNLKLKDAIVVGFAQVFALVPGSSRSGTTITGGLFSGLTREAAARFSFLLSIPAVGASGLLELPHALKSVSAGWTALAVATAVSAVSGYLSIAFLLRFLQRHTTFAFVGYRIALGIILIALLMTGRIQPF